MQYREHGVGGGVLSLSIGLEHRALLGADSSISSYGEWWVFLPLFLSPPLLNRPPSRVLVTAPHRLMHYREHGVGGGVLSLSTGSEHRALTTQQHRVGAL
jgi:hypothetical protein